MVAIEFALLFLLGVLPLLLLTITGVMIFAAKQSLELAAADGARAALQYPAPNTSVAQAVAGQRMQWLLNFSDTTPAEATSISQAACNSNTSITCVTVETSYDYNTHPFLPGTTALYGWTLGNDGKLTATATIQMPAGTLP